MGLGSVVDIGGSLPAPVSAFGRMAEASPGKDSVTGHWELTGVVLDRPFPLFVDGFPLRVIADLERRIGYKTLGNTKAFIFDFFCSLFPLLIAIVSYHEHLHLPPHLANFKIAYLTGTIIDLAIFIPICYKFAKYGVHTN